MKPWARKQITEATNGKKTRDRVKRQTSILESNPSYGKIPAHAFTPFAASVRIRIVSYRNRLCDADGISAKYAIDGFVRCGILRDDTTKEITEVTYSQVKCKRSEERTVIEIEEVEL